MTAALADDWMVARRRRGRDTVVERVENHTREITLPAEYVARIEELERAMTVYADKLNEITFQIIELTKALAGHDHVTPGHKFIAQGRVAIDGRHYPVEITITPAEEAA